MIRDRLFRRRVHTVDLRQHPCTACRHNMSECHTCPYLLRALRDLERMGRATVNVTAN